MDNKIKEIAERIKGLREILEISAEEMAKYTDVPLEQYVELEAGNLDFSISFVYAPKTTACIISVVLRPHILERVSVIYVFAILDAW